MKKILLFNFCILISTVYAQQWEWAKPFIGGHLFDIKKTASDNFGNVFLLGYLNSNNIYESTSLDSGIYIAKFESNGTFLWAKNIPNTLNENPHASNVSMDIDANGDVIVLGSYRDSFSFNQFTAQAVGGKDIFLLKVNTLGQGVWLKSFGGNSNDIGSAIIIDSLSIYITGTTSLNATFGSLTLNDTSTNIQYICKLNTSGSSLWVEKSSYENSSGLDISIGENGNVYTIGIINCDSYLDYCTQYLNKYSPFGVPSLSKIYGTPEDPADIISKGDQIYIYERDCSPGCCWSYLTKYDTQLNQKWTKSMGNSYSDYWFRDVHLGLNNSIYVSGSFGLHNPLKDSIQFDSIWIKNNHLQSSNLAIARMDSNGIFQMVKPFYFKNNAAMIFVQMSIDTNYNCYIAGSLAQTDTAIFGEDTIICSEKGVIAKLSNTKLQTNVLESEKENAIEVFPNPTSGIFTIIFNNKEFKAKVCVYDLLGNCVLDEVSVKNSQEINLSNQPKGIYFIEIMIDCERVVKKIILQ